MQIKYQLSRSKSYQNKQLNNSLCAPYSISLVVKSLNLSFSAEAYNHFDMIPQTVIANKVLE